MPIERQDIFDTLEADEQSKPRDVFDEIEIEQSIPSPQPPERDVIERPIIGATGTWEDESGLPENIDPLQRRQLALASEQAAAAKEGEAASRTDAAIPNLDFLTQMPSRDAVMSVIRQQRELDKMVHGRAVMEAVNPGSTLAAAPLERGVNQAKDEFIEGQATPLGVGTMAATLGLGGATPVLQAAGRVAGVIFAYEGAKGAIEQGQRLKNAETPEEQIAALTGLGISIPTALGGTAAAFHLPRPRIMETARVLEKVDRELPGALEKTKTALAEAAKKGEVENAIQEQTANESVLREERPEVGLQGVEQPRAEVQGTPEVREQAQEVAPVDKFLSDVESGTVKTTEAARDFGKTITSAEDIARLNKVSAELEQKGLAELKSAKTPEELQAAIDNAAKPQMLNEAIEWATGASEFKGKDVAKFKQLRDAGQPATRPIGEGAPPEPPPPLAEAAPAAPSPERATLEDVYQRFEPSPKERKGLKRRGSEAVESFRTGFSSKFRPLNKLAEDVAKSVGGKSKDVAGVFEQLKGSSGKAEADIYRFDREVADAVKGNEKDFNAYMFLRRSLDRLKQDVSDIARAQAGEEVGKLNRRAVSEYTIPQLEAKLAALSEQVGGEKLSKFDKAADAYQKHMDQALKLQVDSGRMSPEVYHAIKSGNQFYAPFKVMKYIEETMRPEGTSRKVDTTADYVKAMEGIEDPNFKLGDMLSAARQNLSISRMLAEKNRAMQHISELAALDTDGRFIAKLKPGQDAPRGMEPVNVMEQGVKERYAVNPDVAQAVQNSGGGLPASLVAQISGNLFRAGATTLNLPFQVSNLLADIPRQALVSKYGIKGVTDLVRYPLDLIESFFSSISGDVFGVKNKLFQDFLDSGAAGTTVQQYLTPEALRFKPETALTKSGKIGKTILNTIPQFANAVEQTSKVLGVKRAMRLEGAESGAQLAKQIPEAITEIRRFSGSPDFGRMGKWTEQYRLNLIYMFLNARIQGGIADVGRLTGRDGASTAAKTWFKMGTAVGLPTAYLYLLNNSDEYKKDYDQRPEQEKQNYWLIPKDTFITGANGEKIRDYWRVPKRESAQWVANAIESGLDFAKQRDPQALWKWGEGMAESIAPINIKGDTLQERAESVVSGTHPFIKAPIEAATGRDLYRHRNIIPDSQKKASPEQQYDERTPDVFRVLAEKMPDVAPEVFRSPKMLENVTRNFTAGLLTQFLPRAPVEGRTPTENNPLLQRFQALPYTDSTEFEQRIKKFERESSDEQLKRIRDAQAILKQNPNAKPEALIKQVVEKYDGDPKLAQRVMDLYQAEQRGITPQERRVLALPVSQRAEYLADELNGKTPEQKEAMIRNWALKRIFTERVAFELADKLK